MDRILIILKKENGPRASSSPALGLNTIIFKYVYWYMKRISGERLQDYWSSGYRRFMNIHESKSDMICISERWEIVNYPSNYLIPVKRSKAMSSRDFSDFVGTFLHFSLIFSYFLLFSLIYEVLF